MFYRLDGEPVLEGSPPSKVSFLDPLLGRTELEADLFLVDSVSVPRAERLARAFGLPQDEKGELLSIESRLRPGETVRAGVFACRHRVGNMVLEDLEREAATVAARAGELLRGEVVLGGMVAEVDQERCSACLSCVRICPYSAPRIGARGKAEVLLERCQGCGACAPLCPSQAIKMHLCSDAQLDAQIGIVTRRPS
jgi:heterodisulfide reductase subunit A-like polyferredoxin